MGVAAGPDRALQQSWTLPANTNSSIFGRTGQIPLKKGERLVFHRPQCGNPLLHKFILYTLMIAICPNWSHAKLSLWHRLLLQINLKLPADIDSELTGSCFSLLDLVHHSLSNLSLQLALQDIQKKRTAVQTSWSDMSAYISNTWPEHTQKKKKSHSNKN